ncbi:LytR/AlgR family response regulator transcription factor [Marinoscillum furvescens]|uniref:LytTR family two component transcriptional regulator n=1 Tax=Marinoscillum furvescens DSM 4134 TaxID=1122208 RepID=A0A3D9L6C5_MARFU|nr:response regulator transcription factor [Marinoscillum furvescens]REE01730.1 LytTR family two component transcriptional regulator [Marinoscillum furvescens DSM 4134]
MRSKKILIIEDDDEISLYLQFLLNKLKYQSLGITKNYYDSIEKIESCHPELLLIDIKLKGEKTGVDIAKYVADTTGIPVIFITSVAITDVLSEIKLPNVKGFLSKPFKDDDLLAAIELATPASNQQSLASNQSFFIRQKSGFIRLDKKEIRYMEADGSYTNIHADRKYVIRKNLKESEELVNSNDFIRIHRSYIINECQVVNIRTNEVDLNDITLPLSKSGYELIKSRFNL